MDNYLQFMIGIDLPRDVLATQFRGVLITYVSNKKNERQTVEKKSLTNKIELMESEYFLSMLNPT